MTKKLFTEKEVQDLSKNPYVKSVSAKEITYTDEFNRIFIKKFISYLRIHSRNFTS